MIQDFSLRVRRELVSLTLLAACLAPGLRAQIVIRDTVSVSPDRSGTLFSAEPGAGEKIKVTYKHSKCGGTYTLRVVGSPCGNAYVGVTPQATTSPSTGNRNAQTEQIWYETSIEFLAYDPGVYSFLATPNGVPPCIVSSSCDISYCQDEWIQVWIDGQPGFSVENNATTYQFPGTLDCSAERPDEPQTVNEGEIIPLKNGDVFPRGGGLPSITVVGCNPNLLPPDQADDHVGNTCVMGEVLGLAGIWEPFSDMGLAYCFNSAESRWYFTLTNLRLPIFSGPCLPEGFDDLGDPCTEDGKSKLREYLTSEPLYKMAVADIQAWQDRASPLQRFAFGPAIQAHEMVHYEDRK